jgi:hypothetical protein
MEPDDWITVNSSAVAAVAYDEFIRRLWVRFTSGPKAYQFDGFPKAKWKLFLAAGSKGAFYHQHIQGRYPAAG